MASSAKLFAVYKTRKKGSNFNETSSSDSSHTSHGVRETDRDQGISLGSGGLAIFDEKTVSEDKTTEDKESGNSSRFDEKATLSGSHKEVSKRLYDKSARTHDQVFDHEKRGFNLREGKIGITKEETMRSRYEVDAKDTVKDEKKIEDTKITEHGKEKSVSIKNTEISNQSINVTENSSYNNDFKMDPFDPDNPDIYYPKLGPPILHQISRINRSINGKNTKYKKDLERNAFTQRYLKKLRRMILQANQDERRNLDINNANLQKITNFDGFYDLPNRVQFFRYIPKSTTSNVQLYSYQKHLKSGYSKKTSSYFPEEFLKTFGYSSNEQSETNYKNSKSDYENSLSNYKHIRTTNKPIESDYENHRSVGSTDLYYNYERYKKINEDIRSNEKRSESVHHDDHGFKHGKSEPSRSYFESSGSNYKNIGFDYKSSESDFEKTDSEYRNTGSNYKNSGFTFEYASTCFPHRSTYKPSGSDYQNRGSDYRNNESFYKNSGFKNRNSGSRRSYSENYSVPDSTFHRVDGSEIGSFHGSTEDFIGQSPEVLSAQHITEKEEAHFQKTVYDIDKTIKTVTNKAPVNKHLRSHKDKQDLVERLTKILKTHTKNNKINKFEIIGDAETIQSDSKNIFFQNNNDNNIKDKINSNRVSKSDKRNFVFGHKNDRLNNKLIKENNRPNKYDYNNQKSKMTVDKVPIDSSGEENESLEYVMEPVDLFSDYKDEELYNSIGYTKNKKSISKDKHSDDSLSVKNSAKGKEGNNTGNNSMFSIKLRSLISDNIRCITNLKNNVQNKFTEPVTKTLENLKRKSVDINDKIEQISKTPSVYSEEFTNILNIKNGSSIFECNTTKTDKPNEKSSKTTNISDINKIITQIRETTITIPKKESFNTKPQNKNQVPFIAITEISSLKTTKSYFSFTNSQVTKFKLKKPKTTTSFSKNKTQKERLTSKPKKMIKGSDKRKKSRKNKKAKSFNTTTESNEYLKRLIDEDFKFITTVSHTILYNIEKEEIDNTTARVPAFLLASELRKENKTDSKVLEVNSKFGRKTTQNSFEKRHDCEMTDSTNNIKTKKLGANGSINVKAFDECNIPINDKVVKLTDNLKITESMSKVISVESTTENTNEDLSETSSENPKHKTHKHLRLHKVIKSKNMKRNLYDTKIEKTNVIIYNITEFESQISKPIVLNKRSDKHIQVNKSNLLSEEEIEMLLKPTKEKKQIEIKNISKLIYKNNEETNIRKLKKYSKIINEVTDRIKQNENSENTENVERSNEKNTVLNNREVIATNITERKSERETVTIQTLVTKSEKKFESNKIKNNKSCFEKQKGSYIQTQSRNKDREMPDQPYRITLNYSHLFNSNIPNIENSEVNSKGIRNNSDLILISLNKIPYNIDIEKNVFASNPENITIPNKSEEYNAKFNTENNQNNKNKLHRKSYDQISHRHDENITKVVKESSRKNQNETQEQTRIKSQNDKIVHVRVKTDSSLNYTFFHEIKHTSKEFVKNSSKSNEKESRKKKHTPSDENFQNKTYFDVEKEKHSNKNITLEVYHAEDNTHKNKENYINNQNSQYHKKDAKMSHNHNINNSSTGTIKQSPKKKKLFTHGGKINTKAKKNYSSNEKSSREIMNTNYKKTEQKTKMLRTSKYRRDKRFKHLDLHVKYDKYYSKRLNSSNREDTKRNVHDNNNPKPYNERPYKKNNESLDKISHKTKKNKTLPFFENSSIKVKDEVDFIIDPDTDREILNKREITDFNLNEIKQTELFASDIKLLKKAETPTEVKIKKYLILRILNSHNNSYADKRSHERNKNNKTNHSHASGSENTEISNGDWINVAHEIVQFYPQNSNHRNESQVYNKSKFLEKLLNSTCFEKTDRKKYEHENKDNVKHKRNKRQTIFDNDYERDEEEIGLRTLQKTKNTEENQKHEQSESHSHNIKNHTSKSKNATGKFKHNTDRMRSQIKAYETSDLEQTTAKTNNKEESKPRINKFYKHATDERRRKGLIENKTENSYNESRNKSSKSDHEIKNKTHMNSSKGKDFDIEVHLSKNKSRKINNKNNKDESGNERHDERFDEFRGVHEVHVYEERNPDFL